MRGPAVAASGSRAVVVFSGDADLPWLRVLRPGFRHCFILLPVGGAWVVIDPLAHRTRVDLAAGHPVPEAEAVADAYRAHGLHAVVAEVREPPHRRAPLAPYTCVEAVKRLLGRHARWVVTPWQLHRLLEEEKILKKENILDMEVLGR